MLSPSEVTFPNNIVLTLRIELQKIDPDVRIFLRPIRKGDSVQAIGITAALWTPDENSTEFIGSRGRTGPSLNQYIIGIQGFNQDTDEGRGLQVSATLAGLIRTKLSRDVDCRVALAMLTSTEMGYTEKFQRSAIQGQRFLSNEIQGAFYHLSNLEFLVETETN